MKKFVIYSLLFLITGAAWGQNYIKRTAEEPVYDVEVIVFGRHLSQPPAETMQQATVYDQQQAVSVDFLPTDENWPVIKSPPEQQMTEQAEPDNTSTQESANQSDWQVPLNEKPIDYEVLVWYLKSRQLTGAIINLLDSNPKYIPLLRQVWRQPTTPFNKPLYVKVNSPHTPSSPDLESFDNTPSELSGFNDPNDLQEDIDDFQVGGQVALSQGRFIHLHIKFNYYRINQEQEVLIYASKQQRQIKLDQWQYFDHPQFGVLIKVTPIKAEELL